MAIDAIAQLALTQKAQNVFGGDNTFLSFPLTPLQYTQADLSFVQNFNVSRLKEFSLLVNLIPAGQAWQPVEARYLWDVYKNVLGGHDTELAQSTRTDQEDVQYQRAVQFLSVSGTDGWPEPSPAVKAYNQFRDQWFVLQEHYNSAKITGETTTDLTLKEHWLKVEEPQLRQQLRNLENRWLNEGFKQEVEQSQEIRSRLGAKNPYKTWGEWNSKIDPNINVLTDTDGVEFYPSSFSPMNALESGSWQTFNLTRDEVNLMVKTAPAELRSRLAAELQTSDIESISLEFSSAAIVRTWLDSDLFKARFWRFIDRSRQLSNGNTPPAGQCPAYVSAVVFARNITVKRRVQAPAPIPPTTSNPSSPVKPVVIGPRRPKLNSLIDPTDFPKGKDVLNRPPVMMQVASSPVTSLDLAYPILTQTTQPNLASVNLTQTAATQPFRANLPQSTTAQSLKVNSLTPAQIRPIQAIEPTTLPLKKPLQPVDRQPGLSQAVASKAFLRLQQEAVMRPTLPQTPQVPQQPSQMTTASTEAHQIYILAFICKPVPLSPNPDAALQW
ncbi:hypothetical protein [Nodosilinea sp. E11]|uniref:hypothetical protein n=1 Tax=Nodosilinea sp. E11 TaxID=3037479 RepID=UPI0029352F5F|nr:hypothetical protein [Nodosilinea sp. E11]WOD39755.1 hypothetical protein RRF56_02965 [Nodosilinea sp. E11]